VTALLFAVGYHRVLQNLWRTRMWSRARFSLDFLKSAPAARLGDSAWDLSGVFRYGKTRRRAGLAITRAGGRRTRKSEGYGDPAPRAAAPARARTATADLDDEIPF